jgi:hypothetical protein
MIVQIGTTITMASISSMAVVQLLHITTVIPAMPCLLDRSAMQLSRLVIVAARLGMSVLRKTIKAKSSGMFSLLQVNIRVTCPDCNRYDFSNVQGFINHCRIAHKIEYASHDDAVRECGVEFDLSEFGGDLDPINNARQMHMTRPGIQSILNTSSTLSGKLPET